MIFLLSIDQTLNTMMLGPLRKSLIKGHNVLIIESSISYGAKHDKIKIIVLNMIQ